jgi:hypothetical protein
MPLQPLLTARATPVPPNATGSIMQLYAVAFPRSTLKNVPKSHAPVADAQSLVCFDRKGTEKDDDKLRIL